MLNPTANGALTLSGNASINIPGAVVVESSSKKAISTGGTALPSASATGISMPDPLGGLLALSTTASPVSVSLSGSSTQTIGPGVYSQIKVSGNAVLTMNPGIYIIAGGGFTVTGNATVTGTGVMIYNAGSNVVSGSSGKPVYGGITLSGTGHFVLSAPTAGPYQGVLIFQARDNTRALSLSGNALLGTSGTIYAPSALLSVSGNAQFQTPLVVGTLNLSGNVALTQMAAGGDGTGDTSGIANTLLAGDLSVYINDPSGLFTADELARIQDAINTWDTLLAPYNVTINQVSDPTLANMVIDIGTSSACGGMTSGVLGCFNVPNAEITLIQGWNWYAVSDPTQIGSGQYDFETTVLHELGHALGLGGATNPNSPMYETLTTGVANRTVTVADLNIPDPPTGADPQMAAGFSVIPGSVSFARTDFAVTPAAASSDITIGLMPLTWTQASWDNQPTAAAQQREVVGTGISLRADVEMALVAQGTSRMSDPAIRSWQESFDVLPFPAELLSRINPAVDRSADSPRPVRGRRVDRGFNLFSTSDMVRSHLAVDTALDAVVSEWKACDVRRSLPTGAEDLGDQTVPWKRHPGEVIAPHPAQHDTGFQLAPAIRTYMPTADSQACRRAVLSSSAPPSDLFMKVGIYGIAASVLTAKTLLAARTDGTRRQFMLRTDSRASS